MAADDPAWTGTHRVIVTGVLVAAEPRSTTRRGASVYAWIWHRLPGRTPARTGVLALLILAVAAALWFYVFPWAALQLPIDASGFSG
jgi:hypothetical protein